MQWVSLALVLGCARLSWASHSPTPTPTSTHTPLVDNSEEEVDEPCFEPCTCEVKEGVLHVHCDGRSFTNVSQVPSAHLLLPSRPRFDSAVLLPLSSLSCPCPDLLQYPVYTASDLWLFLIGEFVELIR